MLFVTLKNKKNEFGKFKTTLKREDSEYYFTIIYLYRSKYHCEKKDISFIHLTHSVTNGNKLYLCFYCTLYRRCNMSMCGQHFYGCVYVFLNIYI